MKKIAKDEFSNLFLQLEQIGINVKLGTENCNGEKDFYLEMLQIYCDQGKQNYEIIKKFYENSNWTGYTAKVHALKSISFTIGAEKFSNQAEKMEQKGKTKNIAYIRENHKKLLQEYENIYNNIFCILNEQPSIQKH